LVKDSLERLTISNFLVASSLIHQRHDANMCQTSHQDLGALSHHLLGLTQDASLSRLKPDIAYLRERRCFNTMGQATAFTVVVLDRLVHQHQ